MHEVKIKEIKKFSTKKRTDQQIIKDEAPTKEKFKLSHFQLWAMADISENRSMVQGKMKREIEEIRRSRAAEVNKQRV